MKYIIEFNEAGIVKLKPFDETDAYLKGKDEQFAKDRETIERITAERIAQDKAIPDMLKNAEIKGMNKVWEAARKIIRIWRVTPSDKLYAIFGLTMSGPIFSALHDLFNAQTAEEAIEKLRAYEEQQKAAEDEIKVGDEIIYTCCDGMVRFVVWEISDDRYEGTRTIKSDALGGWTWVKKKAKGIKKTGRHFPEVADLLKKMKGGAE